MLTDCEDVPDYHLSLALKTLASGQYKDLMAVQCSNGQWVLTKHASEHFLAYKAVLYIASCVFGLDGCIGARIGR